MPGGQEYVEPAAADVIESKGGEVHGMAILLDKGQYLNDVRRTLSLVDPLPLSLSHSLLHILTLMAKPLIYMISNLGHTLLLDYHHCGRHIRKPRQRWTSTRSWVLATGRRALSSRPTTAERCREEEDSVF